MIQTNKQEWLEERKKGIGGSDSAAIVGRSPYKTNIQLWKEKTGKATAEDISEKEYVKYGVDMEPILRESFKIKNPEYEVIHEENTIIRHPKYPFLFASLDGMLIHKETREVGILEIKTANVKNPAKLKEWKDKIPDYYFTQILHYMNVTGAQFVYLFAELNYAQDYQTNKTYLIRRENVEEDIRWLEEQEIDFWNNYVLKNIEPNLKIEF